MKKLILTSGPQGAGKSSYMKNIESQHGHVGIVSRDDFLVNLYGRVTFDKYIGSPRGVYDSLLEKIKALMIRVDVIIFDHWNGYDYERKAILKDMRELGFEHISCWKFITPLYVCRDWYKQREKTDFHSDYNYHLYHKLSVNIDNEGFDSVRLINPLQLTIPNIPEI